MFDTIIDWTTDAMVAGGAWALALVMLIENLFPPIPSEAVLPFAGFLVEQGELGAVQAMVASTAGSVAGALILYALGRYGGRPVVLRYGYVLRVTERDLDRAERWFERHGDKVVFFARMVPLARSVVSVPAATASMPLVRFTVLTTLGSALWNALLIGGGYLLGANYALVEEYAATYSTIALPILAVATLAGAWWWWRSRRRRALERARPT